MTKMLIPTILSFRLKAIAITLPLKHSLWILPWINLISLNFNFSNFYLFFLEPQKFIHLTQYLKPFFTHATTLLSSNYNVQLLSSYAYWQLQK